MKRALLALVLPLALAGCGGSSHPAAKTTPKPASASTDHLTVLYDWPALAAADDSCDSAGNKPGGLTVKDASSKIIGVADMRLATARDKETCEGTYETDVPDGASFYVLSLDGRSGDVKFSRDEMVSKGWTVTLNAP